MINTVRIFFAWLSNMIAVLITTGLIITWITDIQERAASHKQTGLISMSRINEQLFESSK